MFGDSSSIGPGAALWNIGRAGWDLLTRDQRLLEERKRREALPDLAPNYRAEGRSGAPYETQAHQIQRVREAQPPVAHGYPMALRSDEHGMYGQAQKDVAAGKYAPEEEEDDEMQKLLRYMFMSELMAGMAGGDPPTPYTVQAGPAARAFPTMPSMFG